MLRLFVVLLLAVQAVPAQPVVVGTGPGKPFPIRIAPGQVTYIYARIDKTVPNVKAEGYPLPLTLGGVSLWIGTSAGEPVRRMPLFSVEPVYPCNGVPPPPDCSPLAAIRFQVPFEFLTVDYPEGEGIEFGRIWIEVDGKRGAPISFFLPRSNAEFVTLCRDFVPAYSFSAVCPPALLHADGTPTWRRWPLPRPGEVLTFYAYGLGLPNPWPTGKFPTSGEPAPPSTESWNFLIGPLRFVLDFRANARPSRLPGPRSSTLLIEPLYAGPVPGLVGLYQVNFVLPEPPVPLTPCTEVESNVTISFAGSSLGIPFCMQTEP